MLRGLQDTRVPMLYAAFGYWVVGLGGGAALAFGLGWQGVGIWIGLAGGLAAVAVLMLWRWSRRWTGSQRLISRPAAVDGQDSADPYAPHRWHSPGSECQSRSMFNASTRGYHNGFQAAS